MKRPIIILILFLLFCINLSAGTPHNAIWQVFLDDNLHPSSFEFEAWIDSRPGEILTETSLECVYYPANGFVIVQCGSFPTQWEAGEVIIIWNYMCIEPLDWEGFANGCLTYAGFDNFGPLLLECYGYYYCDFYALPVTGFVPLEVQFHNESYGLLHEWQWDFQNDGIIDSNEENPVFVYNETGIYSVRLTCNYVYGDSLYRFRENYIHVDDILPPSDVITDISNNDIILSWTAVNTTALGNPVVIDHYNIYFSSNPYGVFELLD